MLIYVHIIAQLWNSEGTIWWLTQKDEEARRSIKPVGSPEEDFNDRK